ncbi:TPA: hypothetical protein QCI36_000594 [Enterobacter ludwigii]|nr:hypothetical protein [Enterobacter ludwigii]
MSVTRYELTTKYRGNESWDELEENPEGAYVRHGNYAALEQRLIESERYGRQTDITIDNLEMKIAQMAAENAGLKDEISNITFMRDDDFFGSTQRAQEVMGRLVNVKTPATDAFLAEVRASAIDSLVDIKTKQLADMHPDTHAFGATAMNFRTQINELQMFAAQLRKGVQS